MSAACGTGTGTTVMLLNSRPATRPPARGCVRTTGGCMTTWPPGPRSRATRLPGTRQTRQPKLGFQKPNQIAEGDASGEPWIR